jgi:hypothetical protein
MESLKSRPDDRPMFLLAQQQHQAVQAQRKGQALTSEDYVTRKIYDAEALFLKDKLKADKIWRDISQLYQGNAKYAPHVKRSLDRLANHPVEPLPPLEAGGQDS